MVVVVFIRAGIIVAKLCVENFVKMRAVRVDPDPGDPRVEPHQVAGEVHSQSLVKLIFFFFFCKRCVCGGGYHSNEKS
jgi:hypothetical protein